MSHLEVSAFQIEFFWDYSPSQDSMEKNYPAEPDSESENH